MKDLEANTIISHYRIVSKIGAGGMGEVYLAEDTRLDRKVAIKFLSDEFSKDSNRLRRFIKEAKATSALNHPNILTVHEIGQVDEKNYLRRNLKLIETRRFNTGVIHVHYRIRGTRPVSDWIR